MLSPPEEDHLLLEAMLEVTEKVKVLVDFLVENAREILGEEMTGLSHPAAKESPAPRRDAEGAVGPAVFARSALGSGHRLSPKVVTIHDKWVVTVHDNSFEMARRVTF
ncbi:t-cell activation rho gtpase-activating hypothetical protein [Limosa lapponica baueri]|uniref:Uncharacterized protein n=1 Tax=Limosa lapponica baueri TaxID=1758121 RepID=A0A2I0TFK8_LIMLA|nr:t-cell activation rho gtpase-activating hypothetical protein [Limosa lapponica baueri]